MFVSLDSDHAAEPDYAIEAIDRADQPAGLRLALVNAGIPAGRRSVLDEIPTENLSPSELRGLLVEAEAIFRDIPITQLCRARGLEPGTTQRQAGRAHARLRELLAAPTNELAA